MLLDIRKKPDAQLVRNTLSGNRDAFGELVHRYLATAFGFALSRLRTRSEAEEVTQESFVRAFERLDTLRDPVKFGPWLLGIVRNCAGHARQRDRSTVALQDSHAQVNPVTPDFAREELFSNVRRMVDELSDAQREVVMLHYFSHNSSREIAGLLEMTPAAVRKQLERARKQLGAKMLAQASDRFELDRDLIKKTLALVAAANAAWIGSHSAAAAAVTGTTMAGVYKIAAAILLVVAGGVAFLVSAVDPQVPAVIEVASAEVEPTSVPNVSASTGTFAEPAAAPIVLAAATATPAAPSAPSPSDYAVTGIVTTSDGEPVTDAVVSVRLLAGAIRFSPRMELRPTIDTAKTRTKDDGTFLFPNLDTESHANFIAEIVAEAPGMYGYERFMLSGGGFQSRPLTLDLRPAEILGGRVVDKRGNPAPNARFAPIEYEMRGAERYWINHEVPAFHANASGRFATRLYAGRWKFLVSAPGFAPYETELIDTGRDDISIELEPGVHLQGRINFADAIPQRPVRFMLTNAAQYYEFHLIETDPADGTYEIPSLRPGKYSMWMDDPEFVLAGNSEIEISPGVMSATHDLTVRQGGVVEGRLLDAATRAGIAGVDVLAIQRGSAGKIYRTATTEASGRFRILGVWPEPCQIQCMPHPSVPAPIKPLQWPPQPVEVLPGATVVIPDLMVDRRYRVMGAVLNAQGSPDANAIVEIRPRGEGPGPTAILEHGPAYVSVSEEGEFVAYFDEPIEDIYLRALGPGSVSHEAGPLSIDTATSPVTLRLEPAGSISGALLDRTGQAHGYRSFTATGAGSGPFLILTVDPTTRFVQLSSHASTSQTGRFILDLLPADTYTLSTQKNPNSVVIELAPGEHRTGVELPLYAESASLVEGRVLLHGEPAPNCDLSLGGDQAVTDERGEFAVAAGEFLYGRASLRRTVDGVSIHNELHAEAGARVLTAKPIVLELGRGPASIAGHLFRNGKPWYMARVYVRTEWPDGAVETVHVDTNRDGAYRLEGLPAGINQIHVQMRDGNSYAGAGAPIEFDLAPGNATGQDIHLDPGWLHVTIVGINAGETGIVRVMRGEEVITELSEAVIERMQEEAAVTRIVERDSKQQIGVFEPGRHTLYVAAYDKTAQSVRAALPTIRFQAVPIEIAANHITALSVDLDRGPSVAEITPMKLEP